MSGYLETRAGEQTRRRARAKFVESRKAKLSAGAPISSELVELYCGAVEGLEIPARRRNATALFLEELYIGSLVEHKLFVGSYAITKEDFERRFKHDQKYIRHLKETALSEGNNGQYSKLKRYSKGWELTPTVQQEIDQRLAQYSTEKGEETSSEISHECSYSWNKKINLVKPGINQYVPVNLAAMIHGIEVIKSWIRYYKNEGSRPKYKNDKLLKLWRCEKKKPWKESEMYYQEWFPLIFENKSASERMVDRLQQDLAALVALVDQCENSDIPGTIPHTFIQKPYGRFYACGGINGHKRIGLHNVSVLVRDFALKGFVAIDMNTFNHALALQIAQKNNLSCNALRYYVNNKDLVRTRLKFLSKGEISQVKEFLTALAYGAETPDPGVAYEFWRRSVESGGRCVFQLLNVLNVTQYKRLMADKFVKELIEELRAVFDFILAEIQCLSKNKNRYRHPSGLRIPISTKRSDRRSVVSSYFQATESQILEILISEFDTPVFPIHDCVITRESEDLERAFSRVKELTGYCFTADTEFIGDT